MSPREKSSGEAGLDKENFSDPAANLFVAKLMGRKNSRVWILLASAAVSAVFAATGYLWYREEPLTMAQKIVSRPEHEPVPALAPKADPVSEVLAASKPMESKTEPQPETPKEELPVNTVKIEKNSAKPVISPLSVAAYQAMMAKDLNGAQSHYSTLHDKDPQNRDALLGLAAVALEKGNNALAERYYVKVLEIYPKDAVAGAALIELQGQADSESRLKTLLKDSPRSGALYFFLGNQYANQSLWSDAQQAYFSALSDEPDNPDFAFNLAISLDHLNQKKLALEYYRKALLLSAKGFPGFAQNELVRRIAELEK